MPIRDPIPYERVAELIGEAEPSQQSAVLHDAWRDYAAKAARPYAWKTFAQYAREHLMEREIGRSSAAKKSSRLGRTALAHRPAFSFSAHMRPCASAAARWKSSTGRTTTAQDDPH